jgi:hypothetical protein
MELDARQLEGCRGPRRRAARQIGDELRHVGRRGRLERGVEVLETRLALGALGGGLDGLRRPASGFAGLPALGVRLEERGGGLLALLVAHIGDHGPQRLRVLFDAKLGLHETQLQRGGLLER